MRRLPAPRAALCAASILVPSSPVRSLACSICQAGDPQFSASGSTALEPGSFSAYLEFQAWQKDSGLLAEEIGEEPEPGREVNDGRQLSLYLGYAPLDRVTLSLLLPWRWNEISEQPQGEPRESSRLQGFGDGMLHVGYVLWRDRDVLPETWLEARGFAEERGVPVLLDEGGRAWRRAGLRGLPANLVWTADGVQRSEGPASTAQWRERLAALGCQAP